MKHKERIRVAAIAQSVFGDKKIDSVYDWSNSLYINIDVEFKNNKLAGFDYSNATHFDGDLKGEKVNVYCYDDTGYLEINFKKNLEFEGYCFISSSHFSGNYNNGDIELYDFGTSEYYNFGT
ncbi:unnamed protein product [Laminaria digitata]